MSKARTTTRPRVLTGGARPQPVRFDFGRLDVPGQQLLEQFDREGRKYLLGVGGIRGGKTWYGARWAIRKAITRGGIGWILVPEYEVGSEIVRKVNEVLYQHWEVVSNHHLHPFPKWHLKAHGKFGPAEIEIHSAYDPDSVMAATLSWAWLDEIGKIPGLAFRNIEQRVLSTNGPILLTGKPPAGKNWIFHEVYTPFVNGDRMYGAAVLKTDQNPHLPAAEVKRLRERWGVTSAFARRELDGEFVDPEGVVYPKFDPDLHVVGRGVVPDTFRGVWGGLDWGFAPDPAAFLVVALDHTGTWWVLHEVYEHRLTVPELARRVDAAVRQFKVTSIYADPSRPDSILQLQEAGLPVVAARKIKESNVAIQKIARLIETDRFKVLHHCANTIREFGAYRYPDKGRRDKPLGVDDHTMDALRYCVWMREPEERLPSEVVTVEQALNWREPGEPPRQRDEWVQSGY